MNTVSTEGVAATHHFWLVLVICVLALVLLLTGVVLVWQLWRQGQRQTALNRIMSRREGRLAVKPAQQAQAKVKAAAAAAESIGMKLREGRFGEALLASEDLALLDACGFYDLGRAAAWFTLLRALLCLVLAVAGWVLAHSIDVTFSLFARSVLGIFLGFAIGWMLPKWILKRRVKRRKSEIDDELPLFIDIVRLLQGVGLSMDQSLHIVVTDFMGVMPILCRDLRVATEQYARGRSREQSLHRLATLYDNDDLDAICRLIVQVDQHGGAVQEPLTRFGARVHNRRRLELKERIGVLTVKMTGVMVLTLLPALLIVTAGAGFLAIIRGLSHVVGAR